LKRLLSLEEGRKRRREKLNQTFAISPGKKRGEKGRVGGEARKEKRRKEKSAYGAVHW